MTIELRHTDSPVWDLQMLPDAHGLVSLSGARVRSLAQALTKACEFACRALVIRGGDGQFCRGMDLREVRQRRDKDKLQADLAAYANCLYTIHTGPMAVMSVVDGEVLGGGVGLMAACDVVLASARATFALPELVVGLVPAVVIPALQRRIGVHRTRWLALTGTRLSAEQALAIGLVDAVVADGPALEKRVRRELKSLLRTRPEAVARLKQANEHAACTELSEALAAGVARTSADILDPEVHAAVVAMENGELPRWCTRPRRSAT